MTAEEYAKQYGFTQEDVIAKIKSGMLAGRVDNGVWLVGSDNGPAPTIEPIYKQGLGESLLDFMGFLIVVASILAGGYFAFNVSIALGITTLFQGLIAFALMRGFSGQIKLLKFIAERVDQAR